MFSKSSDKYFDVDQAKRELVTAQKRRDDNIAVRAKMQERMTFYGDARVMLEKIVNTNVVARFTVRGHDLTLETVKKRFAYRKACFDIADKRYEDSGCEVLRIARAIEAYEAKHLAS